MATNNKFLSFLENGIKAFSKENTEATLGDRSTYVGSSDIGQCPRKAFLTKTQPVEASFQQELVFLRGHMAESIIRCGLQGGKIPFEEQVEVVDKGDHAFIKTHIDFVADVSDESIVIECKSTNAIPQEPYLSWILQVQLQMGLLRKQKKVDRGIIAVINLNSGLLEAFDIPYSEEMFQMALDRAKNLWEALETKQEPQGEVGSLCSFCAYKANCPLLHKGADSLPLELEQDALRYAELQKQNKEAQKEADGLKSKIMDFMSATGTKKVQVQDLSISYSLMKGRIGVDSKALAEQHPEIFEALKTVGKDYGMLRIS